MKTYQGSDVRGGDAADTSTERAGSHARGAYGGRVEFGSEHVDDGEGSRNAELADHGQGDGAPLVTCKVRNTLKSRLQKNQYKNFKFLSQHPPPHSPPPSGSTSVRV